MLYFYVAYFFLLQINRMNKNIEKSNEFRGGPKVRETFLFIHSLNLNQWIIIDISAKNATV